jgi:hypothetical protein
VETTFDVKRLPGLRFPEVVGFQKEAIHHTFVAPAKAGRPGPRTVCGPACILRLIPWIPSLQAPVRSRSTGAFLPGPPRPGGRLSQGLFSKLCGAWKMAPMAWQAASTGCLPEISEAFGSQRFTSA